MAIKSLKKFPVEGTCFQLYPSKIMLKVFTFSLLTRVKSLYVFTLYQCLSSGDNSVPQGDIWQCVETFWLSQLRGAAGIVQGGVRGAQKNLAMHRTAPTARDYPAPRVRTLRLGNPDPYNVPCADVNSQITHTHAFLK